MKSTGRNLVFLFKVSAQAQFGIQRSFFQFSFSVIFRVSGHFESKQALPIFLYSQDLTFCSHLDHDASTVGMFMCQQLPVHFTVISTVIGLGAHVVGTISRTPPGAAGDKGPGGDPEVVWTNVGCRSCHGVMFLM